MPELATSAPLVTLELAADLRDLGLLRGEADMAIRLARPSEGGHSVSARRVGLLRYGAFQRRGAPGGLPWLTYDRAMGFLPQAIATEHLAAQRGEPLAHVRVNDAETMLRATLAGLGRSILPVAVANGFGDLHPFDVGDSPLVEREVWLLTRRDQQKLERIESVKAWANSVLRDRLADS